MGQFEMKSVVTVKCESERCKRVLNVSAAGLSFARLEYTLTRRLISATF